MEGRGRVNLLGPRLEQRVDELVRERDGRLWSAVMLARDLPTCRSILRGLPVMVRNLQREPLRRALRGTPPPAREFIQITLEHLDAVVECGPLHERSRDERAA